MPVIRLFNVFAHMRKKPYWGNHFWAKGYCVDTVGLNSEMVQKYVRYQEKEEMHQQQLQLKREGEPSTRARYVCPFGGRKTKPRSTNAVFYFEEACRHGVVCVVAYCGEMMLARRPDLFSQVSM